MPTRPEKMLRWFIFSVVVSLVPLATTYFGLKFDRRAANLEIVVARGELLLICTTVAAAGIGELLAGGREHRVSRMIAGGGSVVIVLLCALLFAAIQSRQSPDPGSVLGISLWMFAGTLLASGGCVYLGHEGAK